MTLTIEEFGHAADGSPVEVYVLDNGRGVELRLDGSIVAGGSLVLHLHARFCLETRWRLGRS